jgi:predicted oxidoreductase
MYHPAGAMPLFGSRKIERLETAIKAFDIKLERYEWYEIYAASGQQQIR